MPRLELLRLAHKYVAIFQCQKIKQSGLRMIRRRIPVGSAGKTGTYPRSFFTRLRSSSNWPSLSVDAARPGQLFHKRPCREKRAIRSVQHVKKSIAIGLNQQLAQPPAKLRVHQYRGLHCVVVEKIVRRKLKMPLQLSGVGIERQHAIRVQIVSGPRPAIEV